MKKILVTGAGGFIGSHLTELLVKKGYSVKAFLHYNSNNKWGWLEDSEILNEIEVVSGDIRDYDSVFKAMNHCNTVFHLAALIGIPYSYISPLAYIRTNIEGTYNVLESSKQQGLENIVITSTSETYGTAKYVPIDESHPLVGQSPYSASKIAADQLAISYFRSFNLPVRIVRPFNTYGPRQSARAIIPTIITQLLFNQRLNLGNLFPKRDLTYVKDTVNGFLNIFLNNNLNGEVINIGANSEIAIGDLAKSIATLIGVNLNIETDKIRIRPENSEVERLFCDNSKIKLKANWNPNYTLEEGLIETIEWIRKNLNNYKTDLYNV